MSEKEQITNAISKINGRDAINALDKAIVQLDYTGLNFKKTESILEQIRDAFDSMCVCGHKLSVHTRSTKRCVCYPGITEGKPGKCSCEKFRLVENKDNSDCKLCTMGMFSDEAKLCAEHREQQQPETKITQDFNSAIFDLHMKYHEEINQEKVHLNPNQITCEFCPTVENLQLTVQKRNFQFDKVFCRICCPKGETMKFVENPSVTQTNEFGNFAVFCKPEDGHLLFEFIDQRYNKYLEVK